MNVGELIEKLQHIDKNKRVYYWLDNEWVMLGVDELVEQSDRVLLGDDIPPEFYERDYKYERG